MPITTRAADTTIFAEDYNRLQEKVTSILGQGGGIYGTDYGYGQTILSSQVIGATSPNNNTGDFVTSQQMNDLRIDIMKCWQHQTSDAFPINSVLTSDTIEAGDVSSPISGVNNKTYNDYTFVVNYIDTNRLTASPSAMSLITDKAALSFTNWNNFKTHDVTVSFTDSNHKRYFFNAGGEIRISAVHSGSHVVNSKPWAWQNLLSASGVLIYKYTDYAASSSAPAILANYTQNNSVVYGENYYKVLGSAPASNTLFFRMIFHDVDTGDQQGGVQPGPAVDENVTGTTTSSVSIYYPTGTAVDPENGTSHTGVTLSQPVVTSLQGTVY
jgi:hypothetical protein